MADIPWIRGTFRHILHPPGMKAARKHTPEAQWYVNDHCFFVDQDDVIHWFGITNPYPADGKLYGPGSHRHIGHSVASHPFGPWEERPHARELPEGTTENVGACFVVGSSEGFLMVYGYNTGFSIAQSHDLDSWSTLSDLDRIDLGSGTRDPCILPLDDGTYLLYGAAGFGGTGAVVLAESEDLIHWKQRRPALTSDVPGDWGPLESPYVHRRGDDYYLFVNHSHRQYQETLVFHSQTPYTFDWQFPLCTLFAHAAEILTWGGRTYISHCGIEDRHWSDTGAHYGLWLAELEWMEQAPA
jgi:hypothetical protein